MLEQMLSFFTSWFVYPGISWYFLLIGISLALAFGAIWLALYWPPLFKEHWLWAVFAGSAILSLAVVSFIQIPLQIWIGQLLVHLWSQAVLSSWLLLVGIPQILLSGLVQEGAKMVPMVVWWWRKGKNLDPKMGMVIGAVAGAGIGIFEAIWAHCRILNAGWTWEALQVDGFVGIAGFWERFFTAGFHISLSALAGYGLAKGKGWQYYLIVAFIHSLLNYSIVVLGKGLINIVQLETYVAVMAVIVTAVAVWLRWRKPGEPGEMEGGLSPE